MLSAIGAMKVVDPKTWEANVRAAMKSAGGRIPEAAASLAVSTRTLFRWLAEAPLDNVSKAAPCLHREDTAPKKRAAKKGVAKKRKSS
jgi:hypothetical protein